VQGALVTQLAWIAYCRHGRTEFMAASMGVLADRYEWRPIADAAPLDEDVTLLVTDGRGDPYRLPYPCRRTAAGWVSSSGGTPLAVTPLKWKPYTPPRKRK
jgi:hypothetical protein